MSSQFENGPLTGAQSAQEQRVGLGYSESDPPYLQILTESDLDEYQITSEEGVIWEMMTQFEDLDSPELLEKVRVFLERQYADTMAAAGYQAKPEEPLDYQREDESILEMARQKIRMLKVFEEKRRSGEWKL